MGLFILVVGLAVFLGAHSFVSLRSARAAAHERVGRGAYMALFSIAAVVGVVLIGWGYGLYRQTGWIEVWQPPAAMRHVTVALMLPSIVLITAAYLPGHIKAWAKHPMLAGVKLWAFGHLLSNGDLGSILLFGSLLAWAIYARVSLKRREQAGEITNIQATNPGWRNDSIAVVLGVFIYFALGFTFHPAIVGVPAFGR